MKRLDRVMREVVALEDVLCNRCGVSTRQHGGDYKAATLFIHFGFSSRKDGQYHESHLCEPCYDRIVTSFKHPPFICHDSRDAGPTVQTMGPRVPIRPKDGLVWIEARSGYHLYVVHADGRAGEIDVSDVLTGPLFGPLRDPAYFARVCLSEGLPWWPNGAELALEVIDKRLSALFA
jgi:hypothetical protein